MIKDNVVYFGSPSKEHGFLSNWYMQPFVYMRINFNCLEQYMMWAKARHFKDEEIADEIMQSSDPREIRRLGRQVRNYDDEEWDKIRQGVVYRGLVAKFRFSPFKEQLLDTGDALLVECNPSDKIWSCGLSTEEAMNTDPTKWRGRNLLGTVLMKARDTLREWWIISK